jgi:hypothetical protein
MTKTGVVVLVSMIFLAIYDLFAFVYGGEYSTISRVIKDACGEAPSIILVLGYLLGHWISPMSQKCQQCGK